MEPTEILENYANACNNGDINLMLDLWASDAVRMPPNEPAQHGIEQIKPALVGLFDAYRMRIRIHNPRFETFGEEIALSVCTYMLKAEPKIQQVPPFMVDGKALTIYKKQGNEWKIFYDCFNSNVTPP